MTIITDPWFYVTAIPAVLIYGIGKGGLGPALGVVAVPMMALTTEPAQAAAVLLPTLCMMDVFAVKQHYRKADYQILKKMLPAGLLGIVLASLFLSVTPAAGLKMLIGILCLFFVAQYLFQHGISDKKPGNIAAWWWGCLTGFSSTAIHAGGGPASIYLLPLRLDKVALIATMAVLFAVLNAVKLIPYTLLGEFDLSNLSTALLLFPIAPIGVYLGVWLLHRVSQKRVYQICYFFLAVSGAKLLFDGLRYYGII
jgi:uncharacterized membrane protein YfcA